MKLIVIAAVAAVAIASAGMANAQEALAKSSGCMNCHAMDTKKMGPSFKDIAAKYKGKTDAAAGIVANIKAAKGHPAVKASEADTATLDQGYRHMYNLQFDQAHSVFRAWQTAHPDDPMGAVSDAAAYLFAEFDRLRILQSEFFIENDSFFAMHRPRPDLRLKQEFESALARGQQLAERALARSPSDENAAFAALLRVGLHSDYLALIENRYWPSVREMKAGRTMAEKLLAAHPECYDAYLAVGVENYMLGLRPAPIRWLLRVGGVLPAQLAMARYRMDRPAMA